jgi:ABC-2 type transport system ATP-binding protein
VALITLKNVSIDIPIYDVSGSSLKKLLLDRAIGGRFGEAGSHVIVNALKNISFEAHDGDRIALVGSNGSGKTTLLRVLADVYPPTHGTVHVEGRVSPMLDAALGMTIDATGWENIRICGMLWGLSRAQIEASIEEIAEFTELGDFLNVPVRTYSMGMLLRLGFAVATLRDPEILLLDEVIGVGDASFFTKAYDRILRLVHRSQILVVASHSDLILRQLCNKAIWLKNGDLMEFGEIDKVLDAYKLDGAQSIPAPALAVGAV